MKKNKRYSDWKRGSESVFADVIIYVENTSESTEKLLELISQFRKIKECKINIYVHTKTCT